MAECEIKVVFAPIHSILGSGGGAGGSFPTRYVTVVYPLWAIILFNIGNPGTPLVPFFNTAVESGAAMMNAFEFCWW